MLTVCILVCEAASLTTREDVMDALRNCNDPEININIVDLGFVEEISIAESRVHLGMVLTNPHCPFQASLVQSAHAAIIKLKDVENVEVEVLSKPPWSPSRLSPEARRFLGL